MTEEKLKVVQTKLKKAEDLISGIRWCNECIEILQGATSRVDMVFVRGGPLPHITIPDGLKMEFLSKMLNYFYQQIAELEKNLSEFF